MENCSAENARESLSQLYKETIEQLNDNEQKRKYIIKNLARSIEQKNVIPNELICEEIVRALRGCYGAGPQYIRKCLEKRYKRKYEKKQYEENAPHGCIMHGKKVPEEYIQCTVRELIQNFVRDVRDNLLKELFIEIDEKAARISELEERVRELQFQPIEPRHMSSDRHRDSASVDGIFHG